MKDKRVQPRTIAVDFDVDYEEDALVYEFITKGLTKAVAGTEYTVSEVIVSILYANIKRKIENGEIVLTGDCK